MKIRKSLAAAVVGLSIVLSGSVRVPLRRHPSRGLGHARQEQRRQDDSTGGGTSTTIPGCSGIIYFKVRSKAPQSSSSTRAGGRYCRWRCSYRPHRVLAPTTKFADVQVAALPDLLATTLTAIGDRDELRDCVP